MEELSRRDIVVGPFSDCDDYVDYFPQDEPFHCDPHSFANEVSLGFDQLALALVLLGS